MSDVNVTAITRLKHSDIWEAAKACGSIKALADHLGVGYTTVIDWAGLKRCPPLYPTVGWSEERINSLEEKLYALTGKLLGELFPEELRTSPLLRSPKVIEQKRTIPVAALIGYAEETTERLRSLPSPEEVATQHELKERVRELLRTLTFRERQVIELRYGLGEAGTCFNFVECGRILKLTSARVRQIESKGLRKLQDRTRSDRLREFVSGMGKESNEGTEAE